MTTRFVQVVKVASASILALGLVWPASGFAAPPAPAANVQCTTGAIKSASGCAAAEALNAAPPPTDPNAPVTEKFGGLTLGVGLGLNFNAQRGKAVSSASVVNGIVRVSGVDDTTASILLESHYFFVPNRGFFGVPPGAWGHGPFVGIIANVTGTNNSSTSTNATSTATAASGIISGYALGWMIGFRQPTWTQNTDKTAWVPSYNGSSSWNFGVGFSVNPNAQTLGDGLVANAPLPAGETAIRFKSQPLYGVILVSSFSF